MNASKEFLFLSELRFLSDAALRHVEEIEHIAAEWMEARAVALNNAADPYVTRVPHGEREARRNRVDEALSVLNRTQGEFFVHLEALLAVLGRISLILFPQEEERNHQRHSRAEQLRALLGLDINHGLRDRLFRNKWLHYDEVLDALPDSFEIAQRFTSRDRVTDSDRETAIRLCLIDEQMVIHTIAGEFSIPSVTAEVRDLEQRVQLAIAEWANRHAVELGISANA